MGFFSKLFSRKKENTRQTEHPNNYPVDQYGFTNITREDGTTLNIKPLLDRDGNQSYQTIIDERTGEQIPIPQYVIMQTNEFGGFKQDKVLMELTAKALQDPQYANYIANHMLNTPNLDKVLNEQHGYVGGVQTRDNEIVRTAVRLGIVDTLEKQHEEENTKKLLETIRGMDEDKYRIYQNAKNHEVHIKTSHAERLDKTDRNSGFDR